MSSFFSSEELEDDYEGELEDYFLFDLVDFVVISVYVSIMICFSSSDSEL